MKVSRVSKIITVYLIDVLSSLLATYTSYALRLDIFPSISNLFLVNTIDIKILLVPIIIFSPIFIYKKFYSNVFRYLNVQSNTNILGVFLIYFSIHVIVMLYLRENPSFVIPRSTIFIQPFIFYFLFIFSRFFISNIIFGSIFNEKKILGVKRCLIVGINSRSVDFTKFLNSSSTYKVYGFIDENNKTDGKVINGIKIYNLDNILKAINDYNITDFLVAIDSFDYKKKEIIFNYLKKFKKKINYLSLENNLINFKDIKFNEINYEEILFPKKENINTNLLNKLFLNKVVAISGAGGSIGSKLSIQITNLKIKKLILIDKSEFDLFSLKKKIENLNYSTNIEIDYVLGDICDLSLLQKVYNKNKINIFYHAAAYKHVELLEKNYYSAIKNNLLSTLNTCEVAIKNKVEFFCLISSDKAVNPMSIMGMTKRYCEKILLNCNNTKTSKFFSVRFGNVINSSGSVIPIFKNQIENKIPVTVTNKNVTRYFMHVEDAVALVLKSTLIAENKKIYALNMGKPLKIYDIARKMISAYGYSLKNKKKEGDISISIIGLKKGEKLKEEIFLGKKLKKTSISKILIETKYDKKIKNFNLKTKQILSLLETNNETKGIELFKKSIK
jgi:FlaA1/EpsC-like NDP-sugar epimerase